MQSTVVFINSLVMTLACFDLATTIPASGANDESAVKIVTACKMVSAGATIGANDVVESLVDRKMIPAGVPEEADAGRGINRTFYLSSKSDAIGRISKGFRKGQILYYSYPGFRGPTVVLALKAIPNGATIKANEVIEQDINPRNIPFDAVSSKEQAIGKISNGILKWQAITYEEGSHRGLSRGGEQPSPTVNLATRHCVSAVKYIAAGTIIGSKDVRHEELQTLPRLAKQQGREPAYSQHPEGKRAKYAISEGQIITDDKIEQRR